MGCLLGKDSILTRLRVGGREDSTLCRVPGAGATHASANAKLGNTTPLFRAPLSKLGLEAPKPDAPSFQNKNDMSRYCTTDVNMSTPSPVPVPTTVLCDGPLDSGFTHESTSQIVVLSGIDMVTGA